MKKVLVLAAVGEVATGLGLLIVPSLVGWLLLGVELSGVSMVIGRVTGIALLALGVGCWPGPAALGMLIYSTLATVYLACVALGGEWVGPLLWPAVGLHAVLTFLLAGAWYNAHKEESRGAR